MTDRPIPPRLFRVTFVTEGKQPRRRLAFVKCPYGGLHDAYAMVAALQRAVATRQVRWFRVDTRFEITPLVRSQVERWPTAFQQAAPGVTWE